MLSPLTILRRISRLLDDLKSLDQLLPVRSSIASTSKRQLFDPTELEHLL